MMSKAKDTAVAAASRRHFCCLNIDFADPRRALYGLHDLHRVTYGEWLCLGRLIIQTLILS